MQKGWLWSLALLFLFAQPLVAQDEAQDAKADEQEQVEKEPPTIEEQLGQLAMENRRAISRLSRQIRNAEDDDAREELMKEMEVVRAELAERIEKIQEETAGTDDEVKVLVWMISNRIGGNPDEIMEELMTNHIESEALTDFAMSIGRGRPGAETEANIRKLYEKSPHKNVKGTALMSLINYFSTLERYAGLSDEIKSQLAAQMGENGEEYLNKWTSEAIATETEGLLETAIADYADVPYGRKTVGEYAEGQLFVIKYLSIGKVAPDIDGEDLDGEAFKLSDYRGKVVVIDFWGDW